MEYTNILLNQIDELNYGTHYSFYSNFQNFHIKTVGQVLDDELMNEVLLHCRSLDTRNNIIAFIALIKYKYLGALIPQDILLEKEMKETDNGNTFDDVIPRLGFHYRQYPYLRNLVEFNKGKRLIDYFVDAINNGYFENDKNRRNNGYNKEFLSTGAIIKMYIDSYVKSHKYEDINELNLLHDLRRQLELLVENRDNLNMQIEELQDKIDKIEQEKRVIK